MCLPPTLPQLPKLSTQPNVPQTDDRIEILEVFAELSDSRRAAGKGRQGRKFNHVMTHDSIQS